MISKIATIPQLKEMFIDILLTKTDKVSDVSNESVLNGIAFGCAKLAQKCLVNQSVVEAHLFPDTAYGEYLDRLAKLRGVSARFGSTPSTTYITIIAEAGTSYSKDIHSFTSSSGVRFELEKDVTIGSSGFAYALVRCVSNGSQTNVDPLSITKVSPKPNGHISCRNEYRAMGGRDAESDDLFRQRIKDDVNRLARNTLSYLEQVFMKINNRVLRLHKGGIDSDGRLNLIVVSVNGQDFSKEEFDELLSKSEEYLCLSDIMREGADYSLKLLNPTWLPIDIDFRVGIDPAANVQNVKRDIQISMSKMFDYRFWKYGDKVEWENLLFTLKGIDGIRYVSDSHFYPNSDINVPKYMIPRLRGFKMRDLSGNLLEYEEDTYTEVYFPNSPDVNFQESVLITL